MRPSTASIFHHRWRNLRVLGGPRIGAAKPESARLLALTTLFQGQALRRLSTVKDHRFAVLTFGDMGASLQMAHSVLPWARISKG
jgi:hypothetical protein